MRFFWTFLTGALSLRLRSFRSWIIVLLLPLLTLGAIRMMPAEEVSAPVRVGVALPEEGAEEFWSLLEQRSGAVVTFLRADTQTIEEKVATAQWDCGLILADDFGERLKKVDTDRMFTLWISEGSAVYPLVRESVAACVAELIDEEIAEEYLLDSGMIENELPEAVRTRLEALLPESDRVIVSLRTLDGTELDPLTLADSGVHCVLRWMVSAVVLVWIALAATDLGRWAESPAARRMGAVRTKTSLMLSRVCADVLLAAFAGCVSVLILGDGWQGCAGIVCYACFWGMLAVVLAHFGAVWSALPVVIPFFPVVSLLCSSVILDIGLFFPAAAKVCRYLPVSLFLRICEGNGQELLTMLVMAAACVLISVLIDCISKKKPA